ncbi:glyoxalase [Nocardiopsis sp. EMB25]|uniref:hypothetical protein n=1 Tax=Nocardiopsis TaxID=2013 RepID=UPI000346E0A1|nr:MULTISPECIES: hypothetical protein [Nocardiopsis]MCY9786800.1 glyoxalase [Nocardiopsis sp. EMB25]
MAAPDTTTDLGFAPHHVLVCVPAGTENVCRAFYVDTLGLVEIPKPPALTARGGLWLRGDTLEIHLGVDPGFRPQRKGHPGILVREIDALAQRLADAGHEVDWDPHLPGYRRFYVDDVVGNRLEFLAPA